jgi:hypothetical protein
MTGAATFTEEAPNIRYPKKDRSASYPGLDPPAGTLGGIVNEAHERAATLRQERGALERAAAAAGRFRHSQALSGNRR